MDRNHPKHRHCPPDASRDGDPRHEPRLDTVAQKPTHIGLGAPVTARLEHAQDDCATPTPGAQPPMEHSASLREPEEVAAGLKAIAEGARFTFKQMGPIR